jgi:chromosome partitioning protein
MPIPAHHVKGSGAGKNGDKRGACTKMDSQNFFYCRNTKYVYLLYKFCIILTFVLYSNGVDMILVVGGTKGGSGKTLLATTLTVLRAASGQDVLLIDGDEQGSAMDFTRQRRMAGEAGYTAIQTREADVAVQVRRMAPKYGDIVIDVGGRDTASQRAALAVADRLLIPFPPTSVDLWTTDSVVALLKEASAFNPGLCAYAIINKAFPRGSDNIDAAALLQEYADHWTYLDTPIGNRKAFSNAFGEGYAVTEYQPRDAKALAEIQTLCRHIFDTKTV